MGLQGFGYIKKDLGVRNRILWIPEFVYPRDGDWDYSDKRAKAIELGQFECRMCKGNNVKEAGKTS